MDKTLWKGDHREALPIPLLNLRAAYSGGGSHERRSRAAYDKRVYVTEALPRVTQRPPRPLGHCPVVGCFGKKINVCRYVVAPEYLRRFDLLVHRFNSWVDSFTAATARSSACLLMLRGDHHIDHLSPPLDFIVLLVRCRFSPKVHIVCRCWLKDTPGEFQLTLPGVDAIVRLGLSEFRSEPLSQGLRLCRRPPVLVSLRGRIGPSWGRLGASWWHLGPSCGRLGAAAGGSWRLLGSAGRILGAF